MRRMPRRHTVTHIQRNTGEVVEPGKKVATLQKGLPPLWANNKQAKVWMKLTEPITMYKRAGAHEPVEANGVVAMWDGKHSFLTGDEVDADTKPEGHGSAFISVKTWPTDAPKLAELMNKLLKETGFEFSDGGIGPKKLATPQNLTAAVEGADLKISWDAVPHAQRYYVNVPEVPSYDETTEGTHFSFSGERVPAAYTVTVVAKAAGYEDSEPATFTKGTREGAEATEYLPPVQRKVYGWGPPKTLLPKEVGSARQVVELELYAGLDWPGGQDDKVIIPDGTKNGATYYVAGPVEDHSKGPVRGGQKVVNLTRLSN